MHNRTHIQNLERTHIKVNSGSDILNRFSKLSQITGQMVSVIIRNSR